MLYPTRAKCYSPILPFNYLSYPLKWPKGQFRISVNFFFFFLALSISGILEISSLLWVTCVHVCEILEQTDKSGDEFISLSSSLLLNADRGAPSALMKHSRVFERSNGKALTRALRHNHDTIKIISQRLLVARKAIFTPCNRVWLSD